MAGDTKELGTELIGDDADPLAMVTAATEAAGKSVVGALRQVGAEIIRLDVGAAPAPLSQYPKLRVQTVIVNLVTAAQVTLTIGTAQYPFDGAARAITPIPFPLVIERGTNMQAVGTDGRIYLIGIPE